MANAYIYVREITNPETNQSTAVGFFVIAEDKASAHQEAKIHLEKAHTLRIQAGLLMDIK